MVAKAQLRDTTASELAMPSDWRVVDLDALLVLSQYGLSLRGNSAGTYPILRMNCQDDGEVTFRDLQFVELDPKTFESFRLLPGDILFNRTNSHELVGRTAILREDRPAVFASYLIRLRVDTSIADPEYVAYFLNSVDTQATLKNLASRGVSQSNISASRLRGFPVTLPSLTEQRAIAATLSKLRAAIRVEVRRLSALRELKAATRAKIFQEGLRGELLKQTEIGEIPRNWDVLRLGDVARISTGTTPATNNLNYYVGQIPFVKTGEIVNQFIDHTAQHVSDEAAATYNLRVYPPGTVMLAMYGQGKTRGQVGLLRIAAATTQNTAAIEPGPRIRSTYLWHYLLGQYTNLRSTGHLGHLSHLNLGFVSRLVVPVPPIQEQEEIETILSRLHERHTVAGSRQRALTSLFESVLQQFMAGTLRVTPLLDQPHTHA
jgi:type I restriction enzyme S subunit